MLAAEGGAPHGPSVDGHAGGQGVQGAEQTSHLNAAAGIGTVHKEPILQRLEALVAIQARQLGRSRLRHRSAEDADSTSARLAASSQAAGRWLRLQRGVGAAQQPEHSTAAGAQQPEPEQLRRLLW